MFISINKNFSTARSSAYKDGESDSYRNSGKLQALNGLGALFPTGAIGGAIGIPGGNIGGGGTPPAGTGCSPCPTGCRTETKNEIYYARPQQQSASDIAVKVARKVVKCTDVNGVPKIACDQSTGVNGLRGLSGCSSCYSGRM